MNRCRHLHRGSFRHCRRGRCLLALCLRRGAGYTAPLRGGVPYSLRPSSVSCDPVRRPRGHSERRVPALSDHRPAPCALPDGEPDATRHGAPRGSAGAASRTASGCGEASRGCCGRTGDVDDAARVGLVQGEGDDIDPGGYGVRTVSLGGRAVDQQADEFGARPDQPDAGVQGLRRPRRSGAASGSGSSETRRRR